MHVYRMHVFTYTDVCIENACIYMHISCVEMHVFTYIEKQHNAVLALSTY